MFKEIFAICLIVALYEERCVLGQNCDSLGTLVYEDIGCKAIKREGEKCPIKYECEDFSARNNSCFFRGKDLVLGQQIPNSITYEFCQIGCNCLQYNPTKYECAILDCAEWLGSPVEPGCHRIYHPDKCCSVGIKCSSEGESIKECEVDGRKYIEGDKFFPKDTCMKCICDKNFDGNYRSPYCKRISCGVQIRHNEELKRNCAPLYTKTSDIRCCPSSWVCPLAKSADTIIKINDKVPNPDLTCKYGDKILQIGEGFERKDKEVYSQLTNIKCECVLPPLLTCTEVHN